MTTIQISNLCRPYLYGRESQTGHMTPSAMRDQGYRGGLEPSSVARENFGNTSHNFHILGQCDDQDLASKSLVWLVRGLIRFPCDWSASL